MGNSLAAASPLFVCFSLGKIKANFLSAETRVVVGGGAMELDASPIVNPVPQRLCSKIGKTKGGRRLDRSSSSYHLIQCVQKRCGAREDGRKEGRKEEHHIRSAIDSRVRRRRRQRRWRRGPNLWIESRAIDKMENGRLYCWSPSRARLCVMAHCEPACPPPPRRRRRRLIACLSSGRGGWQSATAK